MTDATEPAPADGLVEGGGSVHLDALRAAVDGRDWAAATAVVRAGWFELAAADSELTRAVLEKAPAGVLRANPLLAMELGIAYNKLRFHRIRALRYFLMAVRSARSMRNTSLDPVDRVLIRTSESAAFRLLGRTASSAAAAHAALGHLEALSDEDSGSISDLPRIYAVLGVSLLYAGDPETAMEAAARGLAEASPTPPSNGMGALALLAGVLALRGDLPHAREHLAYARTGPWTDQQRNGYSGTLYRVAEAVAALEGFDAATARAELDSLLAMTSGRHANEHWTTIARVAAAIELVDGDPAAGLATLDEFADFRAAEGRSTRARSDLARTRSLLLLALGDPDAALAVAQRDIPPGPGAQIQRARVALALGQTGTALDELRTLRSEHLSLRDAAEAAAIESAVLLRISPTPRRDGVIQRLGALLERTQLRLPLALLPPADVDRVAGTLAAQGYTRVTADLPDRFLLRDVEPEALLSDRELAVLRGLVRTGSVSEIAAVQVVSVNTVKTQLRSVYRKLGVSNREDAVAVARERHLLPEHD
ncbi:helix-turn-helix transcriptional regulator [Leifsonia sp. F6_8S_P_1B]|uniref:Helix-turn-helix transcriptional regulator n=1 Tax=Leifsonia williamsii TaxID=3035919 RepID=A0ABT8K740_9MICO|nr:helix-turn-helix transcriptional regulator [Leifsonia williamsii]MDN4612847.1 helix-turn-helix transcriptional regulator [Leifsonia williamsii]